MQNTKQERCLRCNALFECRVDAIKYCQCSSVALSDETIRFLEQTGYGCLCANCLRHYQLLIERAQPTHPPKNPGVSVENKYCYSGNSDYRFNKAPQL
ncbi:MAG: hypothetical protein CHH17_14690 [Candidatus Fluviicola riflensis]|nr:MAG: hypothetical protein CHH17_14690 [Candidatus Fluviicola riflensis]